MPNDVRPFPRRTDAARNRARIIEVTLAAIDADGTTPSMAEIARRAGVGMATLYRNFPSQLNLIAELYRGQVDEICAWAVPQAGLTAGESFFSWLERFHGAGARKGPLAMLLRSTSTDGEGVLGASRQRVIDAGAPLLAAAQSSGEVRDDVGLGIVLDALVAISEVDADPDHPGVMSSVLRDGLRTTRAGAGP